MGGVDNGTLQFAFDIFLECVGFHNQALWNVILSYYNLWHFTLVKIKEKGKKPGDNGSCQKIILTNSLCLLISGTRTCFLE